jgi:hypothetical protein
MADAVLKKTTSGSFPFGEPARSLNQVSWLDVLLVAICAAVSLLAVAIPVLGAR